MFDRSKSPDVENKTKFHQITKQMSEASLDMRREKLNERDMEGRIPMSKAQTHWWKLYDDLQHC